MENRFYCIVHREPYNHLEEEAFLRERDPALFGRLTKEAEAAPPELVREYGLDAVLYLLKREKAGEKAERPVTDPDEDALCGIFRFLGRVYRTLGDGERQTREEDAREVSAGREGPGTSRDRFYACCARAFRGLESGHLHLYEADLAKALPFLQKGGGDRDERELFLLLLLETAPCLSRRLLDLEGFSPEGGRKKILTLLEKGRAGSEAVIQVMGRVRGHLLVRPGESPEEVIKRGELLLGESGLDVSGYQARYIPGKVISFWIRESE